MLGIVDLGQQLQQVDAGGADAQQRAVLVQRLHQAPVATATVDPLQALGLAPAQLAADQHRHDQAVGPAGAVHVALAQMNLVAMDVAQAAAAILVQVPFQAIDQA